MNTACYRGVPLIGFAAYSGSGKTTLLKRLLPAVIACGLRPAVIKHAHHEFDIDYPGKDSYELRKAGAGQVVVGSANRWAKIVERRADSEPTLAELLAHLSLAATDIIFVEGFRHEFFPKIEIQRDGVERVPFHPGDPDIVALVSDGPVPAGNDLPRFRRDDIGGLATFITTYCERAKATR